MFSLHVAVPQRTILITETSDLTHSRGKPGNYLLIKLLLHPLERDMVG